MPVVSLQGIDCTMCEMLEKGGTLTVKFHSLIILTSTVCFNIIVQKQTQNKIF